MSSTPRNLSDEEVGNRVDALSFREAAAYLPVDERFVRSALIVTALPVARTTMIGRDRALVDIAVLLSRDEVRLVTLTGPGGVGKTRLAITAADALSANFDDGVRFVSLAAIRDPELVIRAIARAIGVREGPTATDDDGIAALLRDRRLLLVLDNFEQVVEAGPRIADVLDRCRGLNVLVTSRARLRLTGEFEFPVTPLSLSSDEETRSEAVQLFEERARMVRPDFALTTENAAVVAAICRRLDGLPLAIELAAARLNVAPPRVLLDRLERRLPVLTEGGRDVPARQQTIRDTIAWSYDLLAPRVQALFRRLSVFDGGFTLEAAEAVSAVPGEHAIDVFEGIAALVENSVLIQELDERGVPRYAMLQTIHDFGLEQIAKNGDSEDTFKRLHLQYFTSLAEQLWESWALPKKETNHRLLLKLKPELSNIRNALSWAMEHEPSRALRMSSALDDFWARFGHAAEGRAWVERSLAASADIDPELRARAAFTAGWLALQQIDLPQADLRLSEAVSGYRALGDRRMLTISLASNGAVALAMGDIARAARLHHEEFRLALVSDDPKLAVVANLNQGRVAAAMGRLKEAQSYLEISVAGHRQHTGPFGTAIGLGFLGMVLTAQGETTRAAECFQEALSTFADLEDWGCLARFSEALAGATVSTWPDHSTRLLAAIASLRERFGIPREAEDSPTYERALSSLRAAFSPSEFDALWRDGKHLALDQTIREALKLASDAASSPALPPASDPHGLTPRELDVLRLVAAGRSNREIGDALFISVPTVKRHLTNILGKLGVASRSEASEYVRAHLIG